MRRFRDIKASSPQDLWLNGGELKFFGPNGWTSLAGSGGGGDEEMGTANNNITKLQNSNLI